MEVMHALGATWEWMKANEPALSLIMMAMGSGTLALCSLSIRGMQAEKRREEKHEIGKLSDAEWELLDIAMRNDGGVEWGWLVQDNMEQPLQDMFVLRQKGIDAEGNMVSQAWSAGHCPRFSPALARLVLYGLLTSPSEDRLVRLTVYGITEYYIQRGRRNDGSEGAP